MFTKRLLWKARFRGRGDGKRRVPQKPAAIRCDRKDAVKGVARRVILVRPPSPELFEEAIFIVRERPAGGEGVSETELLEEARRAAQGYVYEHTDERRGIRRRFLPALYATAGALAATISLLLVYFILLS